MDGVWSLQAAGKSEEEVLNLPLDRFFAYVEIEKRRRQQERKSMVQDTVAAIGSVFGKSGNLDKYLTLLEQEGEGK